MSPHIKDVATAAGVSVSTVSRALRGLPSVKPATMELVQDTAEKLGYVPSAAAAAIATGRTRAVNVVVPAIATWFFSSVLEGVDSELRAAGYDMALFDLGYTGTERERVFHRSILRHRGDAVLALCIDFSEAERQELRATDLPTIVVGNPVSGLRFVGIDEVAAARMATEHLIALGHRDILHLSGGDEVTLGLNVRVPDDRLAGFKDALTAAGIPLDPSRVRLGRFTAEASRAVMDDILDGPGPVPTAVFAASDEMAMGALMSIYHHRLRVPDDISVIGIDDHKLSAPFGLTTIAQHPIEQGAAAARIILDELRGRPAHQGSLLLPVTLIDRGSTATPAAGLVRNSR